MEEELSTRSSVGAAVVNPMYPTRTKSGLAASMRYGRAASGGGALADGGGGGGGGGAGKRVEKAKSSSSMISERLLRARQGLLGGSSGGVGVGGRAEGARALSKAKSTEATMQSMEAHGHGVTGMALGMAGSIRRSERLDTRQ